MGARGNIVIKERDGVYIHMYTHWKGYTLPQILQTALIKGQSRWTDDEYLNRVIFQTLVGKDDTCEGFGLSTSPSDNEFPYLVVDHHAGKVYMTPNYRNIDQYSSDKVRRWTFTEYIALEKVGSFQTLE